MTNPKGQRFRHDTVKWCRTIPGVVAEPIPQSGKKDQSDLKLELPDLFILELKATKVLDSSGFLKQAFEERDNWAAARNWPEDRDLPCAGALWKRPRQPVSQALFMTTLSEIIRVSRTPF